MVGNLNVQRQVYTDVVEGHRIPTMLNTLECSMSHRVYCFSDERLIPIGKF